MPTEVELKLVADNKDAVKGIKEVANESQKLSDKQVQNQKKASAIYDQEIATLKELYKWKDKTNDPKMLDKYNKAIDESVKKLKELDSAESSVEQSTSSATSVLLKWGAAFVSTGAIISAFKAVIESTGKSADKFAAIMEGIRQGFNRIKVAIATLDFKDFTKNVKAAINEGIRYAEGLDLIDDKTRALRRSEATLANEVLKQRVIQNDATKSQTERNNAGKEAIRIEEQLAVVRTGIMQQAYQNEIDNIKQITGLTEEQILLYVDRDEAFLAGIASGEQYNALIKEREALEIQALTSNQIGTKQIQDRVEKVQKLNAAINGASEEQKKWGDIAARVGIPTDEKYNVLVEKSVELERARGSAIESTIRIRSKLASGEAALLKDSKTNEESLKETSDYYKTVGILLKKSFDEENKAKEDRWKFSLELGKKQFEADRDLAKAEYDAREEERIKAEKQAEKALDDKKKAIEAIQDAIREFAGVAADILDQQVEDAARTRELLDTQISEANDALQIEVDLYKAGYASNVAEKQKQVEALKKLRAKAIAEEEAAIKKQQRLDTITQTANLITSATEIYKSFSKIPVVGIPLAIAMIATMFASFAAVKSQAAAAGKFAKGGWTGEGSGRDETGERVAGTVHEREFVVRKGPAHRFRDVLEAINKDDKRAIFNSFNRLSPDLVGGSTINNVVVQNDGPNQRLDEVNNQLRRLNSKEDVSQIGNITIIKKGLTTRIIKR